MYACIYVCVHVCMHVCMYLSIYSHYIICFLCAVCKYACMNICIYTVTHTYTHIHAYIYTYLHTYMHTYIHTHTYTHTHTHSNTQAFYNTHPLTTCHQSHIHIHTYTHTYIHTYIHTYTHTYIQAFYNTHRLQFNALRSGNTQTGHSYTQRESDWQVVLAWALTLLTKAERIHPIPLSAPGQTFPEYLPRSMHRNGTVRYAPPVPVKGRPAHGYTLTGNSFIGVDSTREEGKRDVASSIPGENNAIDAVSRGYEPCHALFQSKRAFIAHGGWEAWKRLRHRQKKNRHSQSCSSSSVKQNDDSHVLSHNEDILTDFTGENNENGRNDGQICAGDAHEKDSDSESEILVGTNECEHLRGMELCWANITFVWDTEEALRVFSNIKK